MLPIVFVCVVLLLCVARSSALKNPITIVKMDIVMEKESLDSFSDDEQVRKPYHNPTYLCERNSNHAHLHTFDAGVICSRIHSCNAGWPVFSSERRC